MTVAATTRRAGPFAGNGVTTSFPFAFKVFSKSDVQVVRTDTSGNAATLVLNSDYSCALNPDQDASPGGTVTYPLSGPPLPTGWTIAMIGSLPYDQTTDITNAGRFLPQTIENTFDRIVIQVQQLAEIASRTLQAAVGNVVSLIFPAPSSGKFLRWRTDLLGLENADAGTTSMVLQGLLLDSADNTHGAGMVGYNPALVYPANTMGTALVGFGVTNDATKGAALVGYKPPFTASVGRTLQSRAADQTSVKDFGAKGDGIADDEAAKNLAEASGNTIYFPDGIYHLATVPNLAISWGSGKCYIGGLRVYLRPTPEPASTIFADIMDVPVSSATDGAPALQRAVDYAQLMGRTLTLPRFATIRLNSQVVIKQGIPFNGGPLYELKVFGNHAAIQANFAGHAITVQPQCLTTDKNTGRGQGIVEFHDMTFSGSYAAGAKGIKWGRDGYFGYDLRHSRITNCTFSGAAQGDFVDIRGFGNIIFENVSSEVGCGWAVGSYQNGDFTGDLVFEACQWQGTASIGTITMSALAASGLAELRGLKFHQCNIYDGVMAATAGANGAIGDVWFTDCGLSFEGTPAGVERKCATYSVAATGKLYNIVYRGNYFAGWPGTVLSFQGNVGSTMFGIVIDGNTFGFNPVNALSSPSTVVLFNGFNSPVVSGNQFHGNSATALLYFLNSRGFTVNGNRNRDGNQTYMVTIGGTSENYVTTNNAAYLPGGGAAVVNDFSSASVKVNTNNLLITTQ
ncbi:glycosyl hydrolase family 28-related protein [Variovorax sp. J31P207]|uniref:glycosyl hydrolase family 28-related protein n=1 Tax=Variovorax sp. J31P207 TaxID=3053510 RepID=UPI0025785B90|nr:glycosyl hydrolase family 28-related protein [Variovorax sp. J31P207]MDM0072075.1 glycosyl hydrolase family 28-related protein [Variovorax sp. J31P207]